MQVPRNPLDHPAQLQLGKTLLSLEPNNLSFVPTLPSFEPDNLLVHVVIARKGRLLVLFDVKSRT